MCQIYTYYCVPRYSSNNNIRTVTLPNTTILLAYYVPDTVLLYTLAYLILAPISWGKYNYMLTLQMSNWTTEKLIP